MVAVQLILRDFQLSFFEFKVFYGKMFSFVSHIKGFWG